MKGNKQGFLILENLKKNNPEFETQLKNLILR